MGVLQAATRVLAGVALRSLDVLDGAVTLPQFRMLAVLADFGRARSSARHLVSQVAAWRQQELARILQQLPPSGRMQVTTAMRQLVEAAGEGYGTISRSLVPV